MPRARAVVKTKGSRAGRSSGLRAGATKKAAQPPLVASRPKPPATKPRPKSGTSGPSVNGTGYSIGTFVVHPKYGVGQVEGVQEQPTGGGEGVSTCLEISFPSQEMKLSIPVEQLDRSGMRRPIARRDLEQVFKVLRGRATVSAERRSAKRVLDYRRRLSQGDPTSLAEAVRDLGRLSRRKPLSYEERRILGTALRILSREVALARGREPDQVREEIESIVYR